MMKLPDILLKISILWALAGFCTPVSAAARPSLPPAPVPKAVVSQAGAAKLYSPVTVKPAARTTAAQKTVPRRPPVQPGVRRPVPALLSRYTRQNPASLTPTLRWRKLLGAVYYLAKFYLPDGTIEGPYKSYVAGCNVTLPKNTMGNVKVRIQAFNWDDQPVSYIAEGSLYVDPRRQTPLYPVPLTRFNSGNGTTLLYPVYNWIPVNGASRYIVEVLNTKDVDPRAEADEDQLLERGRSTGFDWYDDESHMAPYTMYWRVRAVDSDGRPMGQFCPPQPMIVDPDQDYEVGTLGDSISHGGGDLSYSPSDWEYSYQYYLNFDSINLSQSGDTSETTLERFDQDVLPFSPKYLFIITGSNSIRDWVSGESVIEDLEGIKEKCEDNDITPIFLTLPPINPANIKRAFDEPTSENWQKELKKVNDWVRQQEYHVDLSGVFPENQLLPTKYALDGLHLNFRGKRLMAREINRFWESLKKQKSL